MKLKLLLVVCAGFLGLAEGRSRFSQPDECPNGYLKNPFERTCLRVINEQLSWDEAKAKCEETPGQYLAVLDGVDALNWFEHIRRTEPGMCTHYYTDAHFELYYIASVYFAVCTEQVLPAFQAQ